MQGQFRLAELEEQETELQNKIKQSLGKASCMILPEKARATWKSTASYGAVDWKQVADALAARIGLNDISDLITKHTTQKGGGRRFVISEKLKKA